MPKMVKDNIEVNADVSQVAAMLAAGWEEFGKPKAKIEAVKDDNGDVVPTPPDAKVLGKEATSDATKPAALLLSGDWPKGSSVKLKLSKTEGEKTEKSTPVWTQESDKTLNAEEAAIAMMETFVPDADLAVWSEGSEVRMCSAEEGVSFELGVYKPKFPKTTS